MITLKRLLVFVACSAGVYAQTAAFPGSIANDSTLKVAANAVQIQLTSNINTSQTSFSVSTCSPIQANMLITIDNEVMSVVSCSGNSMVVASRPFADSNNSSSSHNTGSAITGYITAWHHNSLKAEVEAIETALGVNLSNVSSSGGGAGTGAGGSYAASLATYLVGPVYFPPGGGAAASLVESTVQGVSPVAGSIPNFSVSLGGQVPGTGNSMVFTWRKNGVDQLLTCTIPNTSSTCSDVTASHAFNVAIGDLVDIKAVVSGGSIVAPVIMLWTVPGQIGPAGGAGAPGAVGPGYYSTSSTVQTIGTGSFTFTTQSGLAWATSVNIKATSASNANNWMEGIVTAYSGTSLAINSVSTSGSGAVGDWVFSIAGVQGAPGPAGPNGPAGPSGTGLPPYQTAHQSGITSLSVSAATHGQGSVVFAAGQLDTGQFVALNPVNDGSGNLTFTFTTSFTGYINIFGGGSGAPGPAGAAGVAGSPGPVSFVSNARTSTYQLLAADFASCKSIPISSGTFTVTVVASGTQPSPGLCVMLMNYGTGVITIARSGQTLNGLAADITLPAGSAASPVGALIVSDGTNYQVLFFENPPTASCTNQAVTGLNGTTAPTCTTLSSAYTDTSLIRQNNTNVGSSAMTLDMSASTTANSLKVPVGAGLTSGADGAVAYDSTTKITHIRTNGADSTAMAATSTSTTTTQVPHATAVPGVYAPSAIVAADIPAALRVRAIGVTFDGGGSTLTAGITKYLTVPIACTLSAYNFAVDTGTATVKTWKVATGTAIPTVSNSISTSGVAIASGTALHSTTMTDFTTTTVTANDIFGFNLLAVSAATQVNFILQCNE